MPQSMSATVKKTQNELLKLTDLAEDQVRAVDFIYERDQSVLMVRVGFGKTVCSLTAIEELLAQGSLNKVLIIAPLRVCQMTWSREHLLWDHLQHLNITIATGNPKQRSAAVRDGDIVVVNFENAKWMLENHADEFDGLLVDELTKLKGGGVSFKALRKYRKHFSWLCGMTGTLVEEGLEFLYYQYLVIDGGATFGTNKQKFLEKYFMSTDYNQYNWVPLSSTLELFASMILPRTFVAESYEGLNDPCIDFKFMDVPLHGRAAYEDMKKHMLLTHDDGSVSEAANAAVKSGKLQQICSGFCYTEDGAENIHEAKMQCVMEEIDPERPTVVVYTFRWELEYLKTEYPNASVLGDGVKESDALEIQDKWNKGAVPLLLIHPLAAGHGLNLQYGGSRLVFCAPIWSRDQTDQVIGRLNRRGQKDEVWVTFCVARNTVEDTVMVPRVQGKKDTADLFRRHLES